MGLEQFRCYILGRRVKVVTDHANLKWLTACTMAPQQAKVARWCMSVAEFDFFIEHRKGEEMLFPMSSAITRSKRPFLKTMLSYRQRMVLSHF